MQDRLITRAFRLVIKLVFTFILIILPSPTPAQTDSLIVSGTVTISTDTSFAYVRVLTNGHLIADGQINVTGGMIIDSSGVVTHSTRLLSGLRLNVVGTLDVHSGGMINVDGGGLLGGWRSWPNAYAETYDSTGTSIVRNVSPNTGGGYGGFGSADVGVGGGANGLLETPDRLGSGGGGRPEGSFAVGGNGGGRIRIIAGTLNVMGTITAAGSTGGDANSVNAGSGSGGSIWINASQVTGTGLITANVPTRSIFQNRWSGSGGRIAIYYDNLTLSELNVQAHPVVGYTIPGAAGTIYLKDNAQTYGNLIVDNGGAATSLGTPLRTALTMFRRVSVRSRGGFSVVASDKPSFSVEQPVLLTNNGFLQLGAEVTMTVTNTSGFDVDAQSGSIVTLDSGSVLNANAVRVNGSTLNTNINLSYPTGSDFQLTGNGAINVLNNRVFSIGFCDTTNIISGTINLPTGSRLDITSNSAVLGSFGNAVTLIKDGALGASDQIGSLTVQSGGVVTHSPHLLAGLRLNVMGTLDVHSGGMINVDGGGLLGGWRSWPNAYAETYDSTGTSIVRNVSPNTGGGYGGFGSADVGVGGGANGLLETPDRLGSGGGGRPEGSFAVGGNGGGRIRIIAGTLNVMGTITAAGSTGGDANSVNAGSGSGGSIWINASQVTGTGLITANVPTRSIFQNRWSGSGGRIAIYYDNLTLSELNVQAHPVVGYTIPGAAGTIYLKDNAQTYGNLIVDNGGAATSLGTPLRTALTMFRRVSVRSRGGFSVVASDKPSFSVEQPVLLTNNGFLQLGAEVTMTVTNTSGFDVDAQSGSIVTLDSGSVLNANAVRVNGSTLNTNINLSYPTGSDFQLTGNGAINVLNNRVFSIGFCDTTNIISGTINLPTGSRLDITSNSAVLGSFGNAVTLIKDGALGASDQIGSLTVQSGGVVTHSPHLLAGLRLNVMGTLDVHSGGMINVDGGGLLGGWRSWPNAYAETYDSTGTSIVRNVSPNTGGGYGGFGSADVGVGGGANGLLETPDRLGSGGGGRPEGSFAVGGNGGGRIRIIAGTLNVMGTITAAGSTGGDANSVNAGSGSGGSIWINASQVTGTGLITANVPTRSIFQNRWSGSGGRIAIYYDNLTLSELNVQAHPVVGCTIPGAAGTIYLKDNAQTYGNLIVDNGNVPTNLLTPLRTTLSRFNNITIRNRGRLLAERGLSLSDSTQLSIQLDGGVNQINNSQSLNVFGTATIAGSFSASLSSGYVPSLSDTLIVIRADTVVGSFSALPNFLDTLHLWYTNTTLSAFTTSRRSYAVDAGVLSVVSPKDTVSLNRAITPRALVQNYGRATTTTPVRLSIGQSYSDTSSIMLNPFAHDTATFTQWTASPVGTQLTASRTTLAADQDTSNDSFSGTVAVIPDANAPAILDLFPRRGGNTGYVTVNITGINFRHGARVKLTRAGHPNIVADGSTTQVSDSSRIIASFDLTDAFLGTWNLHVTNPDTLESIFFDAFTVEAGVQYGFSELEIDIVGRREIRVDRPSTIWFEVRNTSNIDEYDVTVLITLPIGFSYRVNVGDPPVPGINWTNVPEGAQMEDVLAIPIWMHSLPAMSSRRISVLIQPPGSIPSHQLFNISARVLQPEPRPFSMSGRTEHLGSASIRSLIANGYGIMRSRFPFSFNLAVKDFVDSLNVYLPQLLGTGMPSTYSTCDLGAFSIFRAFGTGVPDSLIDSLSQAIVKSHFIYFTDHGEPLEPPDSLNESFAISQTGCNPGDPCLPLPPRFPLDIPSCITRDKRGTPQGFGASRGVDNQGRPKTHKGTDYKSPHGTQVHSPVGGTIVEFGYQTGDDDVYGWGYYVKIRDDCGNIWLFAHLDRYVILNPVHTGDVIGYSGESGAPGQPHLHVEFFCKDGTGRRNGNGYFGQDNCDANNQPPRGVERAQRTSTHDPVRSGDPNDKSGTQGITVSRYISPQDQVNYIVFCENVDTASAAAQEIILKDTLDLFKVDKWTFELKTISFGNHAVDPPLRSRQFSTTVDLRPQDSLLIVINASLDTLSGIVSWRLQAIDPNTGKPPENPQKGVLPPNITPPEGEGSVSFSIMPRGSLAFETEIRNRASIVFDTNPAILTGEWFNTIDNKKPHSRVLPLGPVQDSTRFPVFWTGTDTGSGVKDYSVYVAVDSGAFVPWLHNTTGTTELFTGTSGTRYRFYSIARDSVGNLELPKDTADTGTITTSIAVTPEELPKEYSLSQNYPNPFNPTTTFRYGLPEHSSVTLKIYNILGQEIKTLVNEVQSVGYKTVDWNSNNNFGNQVASGVYFYRIEATGIGNSGTTFMQVKKMLLLK